jgi:aspartyl-tRNA(Asn)/glutamyl-tRNA(Gln) amidotransferase subunit B
MAARQESPMAAGRESPGDDGPFEAVIGLEVHVQLSTRSKMFCGCENRFGAAPNSLVCPVCLGHPGSLPVVNRSAVESAVRVGLACGSEIATATKFDRKNYYYPDLPKSYQISQYDQPIATGGGVEVMVGGLKRRIGLTRIHLEEDAGKSIHVEGRPESWVDLNRAGVPLIEIVSRPDLRSPEAAGAYMRMLRQIMLYLGVSDCNMEEGSLRCDSNVSIRPRGAKTLETRVEIKNLNSFVHVESAIAYEIRRQTKVRAAGGSVEQETRLYDPDCGETRPMRGKEEEHDYRYFPDPDLAPLKLDAAWLRKVRETLPELPVPRMERFQAEYGLSAYHAEVLVKEREVADFFEACAAITSRTQPIANWMVNSVREEMNVRRVGLGELGITPKRLVEVVEASEEGRVSKQRARDVFRAMLGNERPVDDVIAALGIEQISDDSFLGEAVREVLAAHPAAAEDVRQGKRKSVNFLVGQVMRRTQGKANPTVVSRLIEELTRE